MDRNALDSLGQWLRMHPWVIAVMIVLAVSTLQAVYTRSHSAAARDQFCALAEHTHLKAVEQLKRTYAYLDALDPKLYDEPINAFVIRDLPRVEAEAIVNETPPLCKEKGLGLYDEPPTAADRPADLNGPPFPPRPKGLDDPSPGE